MTEPSTSATTSVRLCSLAELADGAARGFDPLGEGRDTIFIVRQDRRLHAYRDACPHWPGTPLPWRRHAYLSGDGRHIACSAHGALFDIATGTCVLGPCVGLRLAPVPLAIDNDSEIHVLLHTKGTTR